MPLVIPPYFKAVSRTSVTVTKDLQMVNLTLQVLSKPSSRVSVKITMRGSSLLKSVVAQFNADQLLTERPFVSALVREALLKKTKDFNLILDDVAITHFSYSAEFSCAVEQKQVAQQEAERLKFVVQEANQEQRAAIVLAPD